ncbi:MAG: hypothetical protein HC866_26385 [Leptolyngbyaceae cyanobacterium RU_5_1]|nr:hypothetical protein [Leptolyngbyaceae cyanobacterium RU_5_1]
MKRQFLVLYAIAILLPVSLKLILPVLVVAGGQRRQISVLNHATQALDTVESIHGNVLTVRGLDGSTRQVQLAGLAALNSRWQQEATGVLASLIQASQGQIAVIATHPAPAGKEFALMRLPNGTLIQQVLLAEGLAKLDVQQVFGLPSNLRTVLQQAQTSAQQQHKNLWGNG